MHAVQMLEAVSINVKFDNVGDALAYGLPLSLFGFLTVFGVLILIMAILMLFKVFFYTIPNGKKNPQPKVENKPKTEEKPVPVEVVPVAEAQVSNDGEVVAAIIAAIEAYRVAQGVAPGGFKVVSFKKRY